MGAIIESIGMERTSKGLINIVHNLKPGIKGKIRRKVRKYLLKEYGGDNNFGGDWAYSVVDDLHEKGLLKEIDDANLAAAFTMYVYDMNSITGQFYKALLSSPDGGKMYIPGAGLWEYDGERRNKELSKANKQVEDQIDKIATFYGKNHSREFKDRLEELIIRNDVPKSLRLIEKSERK